MKVVEIGGKKIVNLTPHPTVVFSPSGEKIAEIPPSGVVARVFQQEVSAGTLGSIPLVRVKYGEVEGLPALESVDYIIVSTLVAPILAGRPEWEGRILVPNSGPTPWGAVRDEKGQIVGVKSLIIY